VIPAGWLLRASAWPACRAFDRACREPEAAQARVLAALLHANRDTAFGRAHGFAAIAGAADYVRRVPIRDYEALRPWVRRAMDGEPGVLTREAPVMFTTTSGTTAEPKFLPVTPTFASTMAGLMRLWTAHALRAHPGILAHRVLSVVSPAVEGWTAAGVPFGAMTGFAHQRLPWLVRCRQALPYAAALIGDHDARYRVIARLALGGPVSAIGTPNPSTLLRLAAAAERQGEAIVRAVHDGTLGVEDLRPVPAGGISTLELREALAGGLRPDPARAAHLAAVIERRGRLVLGEAWPELALVGCWLGGSAGVQARHLDAHVGPGVARRDLGLIASEGRLTVPIEDGTPAGVLAVHAGFFEFVPEDELEAPSPRTLRGHELEDGGRYGVVLTGANGLYRYDLNDVVEVRGFHHRTPRLAFLRKGRDMVSVTGEKLHVDHLQAAVRAAEQASGLAVWQFRLVPDAEASRHDVLIEPVAAAGAEAALPVFAAALDRTLARVNVEYAGKRASGRLGPPRLHLMRAGWSERLSRAEFAAGRRENQYKWRQVATAWDAASRAEVVACDAAAPRGSRPDPPHSNHVDLR
jgi:hypothetical protein